VPKFVDEVLIISNNSTDNTVEEAFKLGVRVLEDNRAIKGIGYGFAHITGINAASSDIVVGADGDGTYPVEQLAEILDNFIDNELNFMSCNRYPLHSDTRIPFKLQFGVWILNMEVKILYRKNIQDILSGMWVIDNRLKSELNLKMGDWNLSPEIKLNAATKSKIKFAEYHIVQHQRHGESHQNYWKTGLSHMWWIFKNRFAF
jgi:glycosyltransferase involved in cell wall biosynthesis